MLSFAGWFSSLLKPRLIGLAVLFLRFFSS
jgi:hypothetical protein